MPLATRIPAETLLCAYLEAEAKNHVQLKRSGLLRTDKPQPDPHPAAPVLDQLLSAEQESHHGTWRPEQFQAGSYWGKRSSKRETDYGRPVKNVYGNDIYDRYHDKNVRVVDWTRLVVATLYRGDHQSDKFEIGVAGGARVVPGDNMDMPARDWYSHVLKYVPEREGGYARLLLDIDWVPEVQRWGRGRAYVGAYPRTNLDDFPLWKDFAKTCQRCAPHRQAFTGQFKAAMRQAAKFYMAADDEKLRQPLVWQVAQFWGLLKVVDGRGVTSTGAGETWALADARLDKIELKEGLLPPKTDQRVINLGPHAVWIEGSTISATGDLIIGGQNNTVVSQPPPAQSAPSAAPSGRSSRASRLYTGPSRGRHPSPLGEPLSLPPLRPGEGIPIPILPGPPHHEVRAFTELERLVDRLLITTRTPAETVEVMEFLRRTVSEMSAAGHPWLVTGEEARRYIIATAQLIDQGADLWGRNQVSLAEIIGRLRRDHMPPG